MNQNSASPSRPNNNERSNIFLLILVLIATALRLYHIFASSLWLDEMTSIEVAAKPFGDILLGKAFDNYTPPFYYALLHLWFKFVYPNELTLRLPSTLADILSTILIFRLSDKHFGRRTAIFSATLYSLSPFAIYYAQEGRMYALLSLLSLATLALALQTFEVWTKRQTTSLVLISTLGLYTHYYYLILLLTFTAALYSVGRSSSRAPSEEPKNSTQTADLLSLRGWLIGVGISIALFLPWLPKLIGLFADHVQSFRSHTFATIPYTFFRFLMGYGIMPLTLDAKANFGRTLLDNLGILTTTATTLALLLTLYCKNRGIHSAKKKFLALAVGLVVVVTLILGLVTYSVSERYLMIIYPTVAVATALALTSLNNRSIILIFFLCELATLGAYYTNPLARFADWRGTSYFLKNLKPPPKAALVVPSYASSLLKHYMDKNITIRGYADSECPNIPKIKGLVSLIISGESDQVIKKLNSCGFTTSAIAYFPQENGIFVFSLE